MSKKQHCEIVNLVVRGGPKYNVPGDPYTWVCYLARNDVDRAYVIAMMGSPTISEFKHVREELKAVGIYHLDFTRVGGRTGKFNFHVS